MAFKKINAQEKLNIVKEYWATKNMALISRKSCISRTSLYSWIEQAENAILETFQQTRPGPRLQDLEKENKKLKEKLKKLYNINHKKSQLKQLPIVEEIPLQPCPTCGQSHWRKNGTTATKKRGLSQRYSCQHCSFSIYVTIKKKT